MIYKNGIVTADAIERNNIAKIYKNDFIVNDNIFINSDFSATSSMTSWNQEKNGSLTFNSWGGYNSGVANAATCYHAHPIVYNNQNVCLYKRETETWLGINQNITNKLVAGETYTFSCEVKRISGANYPSGGVYVKKTAAATASDFINSITFDKLVQGEWVYYSTTFVVPTTAQVNSTTYFYIYGMNGGAGEFILRYPKLELGSIATPWCKSSLDDGGAKKISKVDKPLEVKSIYEY